jgi:acetyl-CoA acetyltransferase
MLYDSFSITPIMALEDLGFCERGEAPAFVESGHTAPGGDLPMNTNGGGLSFAHTGMYGVFTLIEAVTQLRGEAGRRQVPRCEVALSHGVGEFLSATGTVLLAAGLT